MAAFEMKEMTRNRCVGWDSKENKGIYTDDLTDDKGNVLAEQCKLVGVDPKSVTSITINDLHADFANGPKGALTRLAQEWSTAKVKWTPDEVAHYLAINSALQDAANESVKRHRPVTDKAADRAKSTLVKVLRAQGKSEAEISKALAAIGMA